MASQAGEQVIVVSAANMPRSCWGVYGRVAVMTAKRSTDALPSAARETADWAVTYRSRPLNVGRTRRCALAAVLRETVDEMPIAPVVGNEWLVRRCGMGDVL